MTYEVLQSDDDEDHDDDGQPSRNDRRMEIQQFRDVDAVGIWKCLLSRVMRCTICWKAKVNDAWQWKVLKNHIINDMV